MPKRDNTTILCDILTTINEGYYKPTNIMYQCNLSWVALNPRLEYLKHYLLVHHSRVHEHNEYHITSKGRKAVTLYTGLKKLLP